MRDLVELGRRVEAHFGAPQDIEWALDGEGTLWLTQSRAITTLYPVPPQRRPGLRVHLNASLAQGLTRPITPMGLSAFRVVGASLAGLATGKTVDPMDGPAGFGIAGDRAFIDITAALRNPVGRKAVPAIFSVMEARSAVVVRELLAAEPSLAPTRSALPGAVAFARPVLRILLRYRVPALIALALARPAAARKVVAARGDQLRARLAEPVTGDGHARLAHVVTMLRTVPPIMPRTVPAAAGGFLALGLARRLAGADLDAQAVHEVLRGLPHNVTTEMDLELWALATRIAPTASAAALPAAHARRAGRAVPRGRRCRPRCSTGSPSSSPSTATARWPRSTSACRAGPTTRPTCSVCSPTTCGSTTRRLAPDAPVRPGQRPRPRRRRARRRARCGSAVAARARGHRLRPAPHAGAGRACARRPRTTWSASSPHARAQLARGRRGARRAAGCSTTPDDVFFLDLRRGRGRARRRPTSARSSPSAARSTTRELRRRHIPRVLLSDGTEPEAATPRPRPEGALVGVPASAGTVTGAARVMLDPAGAHLEPGEILVAPSTDPGWTPLFLTAGGLVMEMGGANSHGAVVAREYGIPAVVGVPDATARLHTGQTVTVDGAAGTVVSA